MPRQYNFLTKIKQISLLILITSFYFAYAAPYQITLVARECSEYTDVMANKARNNIMQSLKDLGPDSIYKSNESVSKTVEEKISTQVTNCIPLNNWKFSVGEGISGNKDQGSFGELSKVATLKRVTPETKNNVPVRDSNRNLTGAEIDGAITITLTPSEINLLERGRLTIQGGQPGSPLLGSQVLGFASLRCGVDNQNADNVEYAKFPSSAEHIFCYAYYINPAPTAAKIIISKIVENSSDMTNSFVFGGNTSFNSGGVFSLKNGQSIDFDRAAVSSSDPAWTVFENIAAIPDGYSFSRIECSSEKGSVSTINGSQVSINLLAGDVVRCNFINKEDPNISPILECTARNGTQSYTAYWGYLNRQPSIATVVPGPNNKFSPAPENRGQPYTFKTGRNTQVFSENHTGGPLTWSLTGRTATSSSSSAQRCEPTCIVPDKINMTQCDESILIDGSLSGTLNNNKVLSSFTWTTNCPGTLYNTNTLRPTLTINRSSLNSTKNCKVNLVVVDDTRFGSNDSSELHKKSCDTAITIPACKVDCAGNINGNTQVDVCGVCGGNGTTCLDCNGIPNGGSIVDQCGVCSGENLSCMDCAGIPNGTAMEDLCGVCGGDGSSCQNTCIGKPDACGVCNGNNSTCLDCSGIPNGINKFDECGVCGGDGSSCSSCLIDTPVDSNNIKNLSRILKDLLLLAKNAKRYAAEASKCLPSSSSSINNQIAVVIQLLNEVKKIIQGDLGVTGNQCLNSSCVNVSIDIVKDDLTLIATKLREISRKSQLITLKCRKPIKSKNNDRDSRKLLSDIIKNVNKISDIAISCKPG